MMLSNNAGCDSIVTTVTTLIPPDSTTINVQSCNAANAGSVVVNLANQFGCDSIVTTITTYVPGAADTTYLSTVSCNPADTGSTSVLLVNASGCDSLVVSDTRLCLNVIIGVLLEGPNDATPGGLMTAELSENFKILPGQTPSNPAWVATPAGQPYSVAPWNYPGTEGMNFGNAQYDSIKAVHGAAVTDWVLVSLRSSPSPASTVAQSAGLLLQNSSVVFLEPIALPANAAGAYHIMVEHRNHLPVMTPNPVPLTYVGGIPQVLFNFTDSDGYVSGSSWGQANDGVNYLMYLGNLNQIADGNSYDIDGNDKATWSIENGIFGTYLQGDVDLSGDITGADKVLFSVNNGLFSALLRY